MCSKTLFYESSGSNDHPFYSHPPGETLDIFEFIARILTQIPEPRKHNLFLYADLLQNEGRYAGPIRNQPDRKAVQRYIAAVTSGEEKPLDFVCYLPEGSDILQDTQVPNVETTHDPKRMMTAIFAGGSEVWPALGL